MNHKISGIWNFLFDKLTLQLDDQKHIVGLSQKSFLWTALKVEPSKRLGQDCIKDGFCVGFSTLFFK